MVIFCLARQFLKSKWGLCEWNIKITYIEFLGPSNFDQDNLLLPVKKLSFQTNLWKVGGLMGAYAFQGPTAGD
jgi:hypothetical protein